MADTRTKPIRPDHVSAYIRWSTDDQQHGTTLQEQLDGCRHYILSQGWQWRDDLVYVDDGYSGGTLDRPGMEKLRRLVRAGEIDCVVALKLDRLSRNIVDAVDLVLNEWDGTCYIKSVREPIDTTTDLGRVLFTMLASFADFERYQIRDRTQTGKERRIREGKQLHGRPAYGYQKHATEKGKWVEDTSESPLLRLIFQMCNEGTSANEITRILNTEMQAKTRAGKAWTIRAVLHILHNRIYIGEYAYGKSSLRPLKRGESGTIRVSIRSVANTRNKVRAKKERVYHASPKIFEPTGAAPPLIDRDVWFSCQQRLSANRSHKKSMGGRAMSSPHLLVGLAQCTCGGAIVHKCNSPKGKPLHYYKCSRQPQGLCQSSGYIPKALADMLIETQFLNLYGLRDLRTAAFSRHLSAADEEYRLATQTLQEAEREQVEIESEDADVMRQVRKKEITMAEARELRESIRADAETARQRVQSLRLTVAEKSSRVQQLQHTLDAMSDAERWDSLSVEQKRTLIAMVLTDRIVIHKPKGTDNIEIEAPWAI